MAKRAAHLRDALHGLDSLVHQLPVVLLWPVAPLLHLKRGVLQHS